MALPDSNITTTLVGQTLGTSSRDVGTLCTHPNINKWSKWKPVRSNKLTGLTLTDFTNANFGLQIPYVTDKDYEVALTEWGYDKPRGGNYNEFYRLGDFRNYNHLAYPILFVPQPVAFNAINPITVFEIEAQKGASSEYQIGIEDFGVSSQISIQNFYFGVVIKTESGAVFIKTASDTISNGDVSITLPANSPAFDTTNVELYFILSSNVISEISTLSEAEVLYMASIPATSGRYYSVPVIKTFGDLVNLSIESISTSPSTGFNSINNYLQTNIPQTFFKTSSGNGYFYCGLRNRSGSPFTVEQSSIRMGCTKLVDGTISQHSMAASLYNTSGSQISSLVLPATEQWVYCIIGVQQLFTDGGSITPMPGERTDTQIRVDYQYVGGSFTQWFLSPSIMIES